MQLQLCSYCVCLCQWMVRGWSNAYALLWRDGNRFINATLPSKLCSAHNHHQTHEIYILSRIYSIIYVYIYVCVFIWWNKWSIITCYLKNWLGIYILKLTHRELHRQKNEARLNSPLWSQTVKLVMKYNKKENKLILN